MFFIIQHHFDLRLPLICCYRYPHHLIQVFMVETHIVRSHLLTPLTVYYMGVAIGASGFESKFIQLGIIPLNIISASSEEVCQW